MKTILFSTVLMFCMCLTWSLSAKDSKPNYSSDLVAAKKQAKKDSKMVMIVMTGNKWDVSSEMFTALALKTKEFKKYSKKFVIVHKDVSQDPKQRSAGDNLLILKFKIKSLPVIILLDSQGRSLGTILPEGKHEIVDIAIRSIILVKKARDFMFELSEKETKPVDKALALAAGLHFINQATPLVGYDKEYNAILRFDKLDELGMKYNILSTLDLNKMRDLLITGKKEDAKKLHKKVDAFVEKFKSKSIPGKMQAAMYYKASASLILGNKQEALEYLLIALNMAPNGRYAKAIQMTINSLRKHFKEEENDTY